MAHRIYKHDKQQGTQQGWHGLTEVKEKITFEDNWLAQWDVVPAVLTKRADARGTMFVDTKWRVLECPDVPGLEVGAAYNSETFRPITNVEFLELVKASIAGTSHKIVSVGSVRNRGRVFLSIELAGREKFQAAGREFSAFLNFGNGHDKSSVLWVNTSNICTVCDNTFSFNLFAVENARKDAQADIAIRQRHTVNAALRFPAIAGLIDKAVGVQAEFAAAMDNLAKETVTTDTARELFAGHIGRDIVPAAVKDGLSTRGYEKVNRLMELFQNGKGNRGRDMADVVSAVSDYYTHESVRGGDKARQFASSEYESGATLKRTFYTQMTAPARESVRQHGEALLVATVN
jgi:hypothetical protein